MRDLIGNAESRVKSIKKQAEADIRTSGVTNKKPKVMDVFITWVLAPPVKLFFKLFARKGGMFNP